MSISTRSMRFIIALLLVFSASHAAADDYDNPFQPRVNVIERSINRLTVQNPDSGTEVTQHDISEQIRRNMDYPPVSITHPWDGDLDFAVSQCQQLLLINDADGLLIVNEPLAKDNLLPTQSIGNLVSDCRTLVRPQCFTGRYGGHTVCQELYGLLDRCGSFDQRLRQPNCQELRRHICEPKESVPEGLLRFPVCSIMGDLSNWPYFDSCAQSSQFQDFLSPPCSSYPNDPKSCQFSGFFNGNYRTVCAPVSPGTPLATAAARCTLNRYLNDNPHLMSRPYEEQVARFAMDRMSGQDCRTLRSELCTVESGHQWYSPAIQASDLCRMNVGNGLVEQCDAYIEVDRPAGVARSFAGSQTVIWYDFDGAELQRWPCQQTLTQVPLQWANLTDSWSSGTGAGWPSTRQRRGDIVYIFDGVTTTHAASQLRASVTASAGSAFEVSADGWWGGTILDGDRGCQRNFSFSATVYGIDGSTTTHAASGNQQWVNGSGWFSRPASCNNDQSSHTPNSYLSTINDLMN